MKVWIIVRSENTTYGHGDFGTCDVLVKTGPYDSGPPHPGFTSLEAAEKYLEDNGLVFSKPMEIEVVIPAEKKGCGKPLAPGQWWGFCGETDMGQSLPALCTQCGGEFKLAD